MKKKKSYKNFDRITKVLHGHTIFFLQPELSQSESYMQGPSPSTHGFVEEHLEMGSHYRGAPINMVTMKASLWDLNDSLPVDQSVSHE